jgi:hypothetical protein
MRILCGSILFFVASGCATFAADEKIPTGRVTGETARLDATLISGKEAVAKAVGSDLGGSIVIIDLKLTPQGEKPIRISRDDFTLKSDNDGQRSQPFAPSQIAGRGALIVSSTASGSGHVDNRRGPIWGGAPGTSGMPGRLPGDGPTAGSATADVSDAKATIVEGNRMEENPLLATLKERILPEKETSEAVSGLLYFHMEGKHKPKHLQLWYQSPSGKLILRFQ